MTAFEVVKDSVDIVDAAERYGLDVGRNKKALCPFHDDKNPSLSFKNQRFKCFACGAGGDVIDLVGYLTNTVPLETVKELNQTYGLRIDLDKPAPSVEIQRRKRLQKKKRAFKNWISEANITLSVYYLQLSRWKLFCAPTHPDDELDSRFVEALQELSCVEYLMDAYPTNGSPSEELTFYRRYHKEVERIAQRLKENSNHYDGGIRTDHNPSGIVFPFEADEYAGQAA